MNDDNNVARIKAVYHALQELGDQVVFVGGATVSLYKTGPHLKPGLQRMLTS